MGIVGQISIEQASLIHFVMALCKRNHSRNNLRGTEGLSLSLGQEVPMLKLLGFALAVKNEQRNPSKWVDAGQRGYL